MTYIKKLHMPPLVLVYDITSKLSLDVVVEWKRQVDEIDPNYRSLILVGNKVDLAVRHREVDKKFAEGIAKSWGCGFIEASAKTATNIDIIFETVVTAYFKQQKFAEGIANIENVCSTIVSRKRNTNK